VIERIVRTSEQESYVEAYPETELVAFDADSDLAVLRVKHLPQSRVAPLALAARPERDEPIVSAGFPESSLTHRVALLKKEGKLLDLAKLPVVDHTFDRIVRESAVDGLLVSTDIEPGFSGGPTCNAAGQVVGINVRKD